LSRSRGFAQLAYVSTVVALIAGCAAHHATNDEDTTLLAQDGTDTSAAENDTETLATSFVASNAATLGLASAGSLNPSGGVQLQDVGDAVRAAYSPAGCLTVTSDSVAHTVTYDFKGCVGPLGLRAVTGTVKLSYTMTALNKLVFDVTGTNLRVNKATVDWSAHAEITAGRLGHRDMTWKAQLSGTTARGREFTRTNTKSVSWTVGQPCVLVNGFSDGNVTGRNLHTDVINYSRCAGQCPAAGSEIKITNSDSGRSIDITYDGGDQATFTGPDGKKQQITPACAL
jgi:hypothetical protein